MLKILIKIRLENSLLLLKSIILKIKKIRFQIIKKNMSNIKMFFIKIRLRKTLINSLITLLLIKSLKINNSIINMKTFLSKHTL